MIVCLPENEHKYKHVESLDFSTSKRDGEGHCSQGFMSRYWNHYLQDNITIRMLINFDNISLPSHLTG